MSRRGRPAGPPRPASCIRACGMELFNPAVAVDSLGPLLGGMLITVELTLVTIVLSLGLGLLVALARMYGPRWLVWIVLAYVEVMRDTPLAAAAHLHLLRAARDRHPPRQLHGLGAGAHAQLLGLHLRGLPLGHPGHRQGPERCRGGAGHDPAAGAAPHRPAPGHPPRHPGTRQLPDLALQGHGAVLRRERPGGALHRPADGRPQLPVLHALHGRRRALLHRRLRGGEASSAISSAGTAPAIAAGARPAHEGPCAADDRGPRTFTSPTAISRSSRA